MKQIDGRTFQYVVLHIFDTGDMGLFVRKTKAIIGGYSSRHEAWLANEDIIGTLDDNTLLEVMKVTSQYPKALEGETP